MKGAGLIAAAGRSRRMEGFKPLLEIKRFSHDRYDCPKYGKCRDKRYYGGRGIPGRRGKKGPEGSGGKDRRKPLLAGHGYAGFCETGDLRLWTGDREYFFFPETFR